MPVDDGVLTEQPKLRILFLVKDKANDGGNKLTDHRGDSRTGYAHAGAAKETEDHDGVQDDIDDGSAELGYHGEHGVTGGLEHTLKEDRHEEAGAGRSDDSQVRGAHGEDALLVGQVIRHDKTHGLAGQEETEDDEKHAAQNLNQETVPGTTAGTIRIALAQTAGKQAVDTSAHTGGQSDHQHLERHGQGHSCQAVGIKTGNEDAVDDVIQRLDQHREHDGDRNLWDQLGHGHSAQQFGAILRLHFG